MANERKIKRFVLDTNTWIAIFINIETDWLQRYVIKNNIEIFIDSNLLIELMRVLEYHKIKRLLPFTTDFYTNFIQSITTHLIAEQFHIISPDPEDNYLFDIALHTNSKLLVTGEKVLLNWVESPVETISLSKFKKLF